MPRLPRSRFLIGGLLVLSALAVAALGSRGPFGSNPVLAYNQFLTDFQAGHVGQITQWRDQLEVTDYGQLQNVAVPSDRDLWADLGAARSAGGVGVAYELVPDAWLVPTTPLVPTALALAAFLIWVTGIRRADRSATMGGSTLGSA